MMRLTRRFLNVCATAAAAFVIGAPNYAGACTTCGTGSSALIPAGQGLPYSGRARIFAELQGRGERVDETGRNRRTLEELRLAVGVAYAPSDRLWLTAQLPFLLSRARWENLDRFTTLGVGDLEVQARYLLFRDRAFSPRHLFGVSGIVQLPTAIKHHSAQGTVLPLAVQSGTASLDAGSGVFYVHLAEPWALFAQVDVRYPMWSRHNEIPGPTIEVQVTGQLRLDDHWSLRAGTVAFGRGPESQGGLRDESGELFALYLTPSLLWSPSSDWLVLLGARVPIFIESAQQLRETPVALLSVVVDV